MSEGSLIDRIISPSRAVSMDQLPQIATVAQSVVWSFSRGQRFVKGQVSRGVVVRVDTLALRESNLFVPLLFNQVISFVNG
jgi:hypothetical protein